MNHFLAITNDNNAPCRLAELRKRGAALDTSWCAFRASCLDTRRYELPCAGREGDAPMWFTHGETMFRDERYAHEVAGMRHTGWFTSRHASTDEMNKGLVGRLTHGRFVAGFEESSGTRVFFPAVFDDENDAARMADEHARIAAEREVEFDNRWYDAREISDNIESENVEIGRLFALRNHARFGTPELREELHAHIAESRKLAGKLASEYSDVEL